MKKLIILTFTLLIPVCLWAQVMDSNSLDKLKKGEYRLIAGKVQVTFLDTVSAEFAEAQLEENGFEILSGNFQNYILSIQNRIEPHLLKDIEENKWVESVEDDSRLSAQGPSYQTIRISLIYSATESTVNEIRTEYPEVEFGVLANSVREAIIKAEEGREYELMEELEKLSIVKNTAMLGVLE